MFCPECEVRTTDDDRFCGNCNVQLWSDKTLKDWNKLEIIIEN